MFQRFHPPIFSGN